MADSGITIDCSLNLSGVLCPMNFVKTKLALEEMETSQVLEVILDEGEPVKNVSSSVKAEGHHIINVEKRGSCYRLLIKKA